MVLDVFLQFWSYCSEHSISQEKLIVGQVFKIFNFCYFWCQFCLKALVTLYSMFSAGLTVCYHTGLWRSFPKRMVEVGLIYISSSSLESFLTCIRLISMQQTMPLSQCAIEVLCVLVLCFLRCDVSVMCSVQMDSPIQCQSHHHLLLLKIMRRSLQ